EDAAMAWPLLLALMHERTQWTRGYKPLDADWADVLKTYSLFAGVSKRRLRKATRNARFAELAPRETVIFNGDDSNALYVILGGEAEVVTKRAARTLRTGDYFGELAMIDGRPRSATVVARSELHVMTIP